MSFCRNCGGFYGPWFGIVPPPNPCLCYNFVRPLNSEYAQCGILISDSQPFLVPAGTATKTESGENPLMRAFGESK